MDVPFVINYAELVQALRPEIALMIGLLAALGFDIAFGRRMNDGPRCSVAIAIGLITLAFAALQAAFSSEHAFVAWYFGGAGDKWALFHGAFKIDDQGSSVRLGVFALSALSLPLIAGYASRFTTRKPRSTIRSYPAEYTAMLLLATTGFSLMAVSNNLLVAFLGFELASFSLYIMAGFDKSSRISAEAGLIYFFFGGMASAFMLMGFSLIYGLTGSITFNEIAASLAQQQTGPLLLVALVLVIVGFGYKAAAAPFHFWAPDVYQGSPAPVGAFIASASKLAGFFFFTRLLYGGLGPASGDAAHGFDGAPGWMTVLVIISAGSILLGNIVALVQTNVRRLMAYSAIAHAGAMLIGVIAMGAAGAGPLYYYALTYGIATVGVFGVFAVIGRTAPCHRVSDLKGLWKRNPFLAAVLFVCVLSLAGIPPLAGFFAKFWVFAAALKIGGLATPVGWLVLLAIAMSAVALYYYLIVLKAALVSSPDTNTEKIRTTPPVAVTLTLVVALIIGLGLFP